MNVAIIAEVLLVVAMVLVSRAGRRSRARARRRSVFFGNTRGHDHEATP